MTVLYLHPQAAVLIKEFLGSSRNGIPLGQAKIKVIYGGGGIGLMGVLAMLCGKRRLHNRGDTFFYEGRGMGPCRY